MTLPQEQSEHIYRLVLDNVLDPFLAIDGEGKIVEWSRQAQETFGWSASEVVGSPIGARLIPEARHLARLMQQLSWWARQDGPPRRTELCVRSKHGKDLPVEVTLTPVPAAGQQVYAMLLRDISEWKKLEQENRRHAHVARSIIESMAAAVVVADTSQRLIMLNRAAQELLDALPLERDPDQSFLRFPLFQPDAVTPYADDQRPLSRALRGEQVDGLLAFVPDRAGRQGTWVSAHARPLLNDEGAGGALTGAVVVFHNVTQLYEREEALALQARRLQEQASLLDLSHDAIVVRAPSDVITYWNKGAERLYGYTSEEAVGKTSHMLLQSRFPLPLAQIQAVLQKSHYWEGEIVHRTKDGRDLTVFSRWAMDTEAGQLLRYLETNTDITQRRETEQALRQTQQNYRLLVEASTDYAMMMLDAQGVIISWNTGAESILGLTALQAIGSPVEVLFTPEDIAMGEAAHELDEARRSGRSENNRWHVRPDGSRFWAAGVVTPLFNEDGGLRGFVKIMRDQTMERLAAEQTQFLANHDALTGLTNRVSFSSALHQAIARADRSQVPFSLLLLDLDRFKYVNDTFGHHVGDLMLKEVAHRVVSSLRETDAVARLGGDEFVIIQSDVSQPEAAETLARKLIMELGRAYYLDGYEITSGASIGISTYPLDAKNSVELLKKSDLALYRAKNGGRGTYQFYTPDLFAERAWKKDREQALRDALAKHQFELYYQPQIDLSDWKISTVEALLRWQASDLELVLPGDFLQVAEETGLIVEIGKWALRESCQQLKKWQEQGMGALRISVNCSARQFNDAEFVRMVGPILEEADLDPSSLELEISESMLAQNPELRAQLAQLRALGVRITIDNYGTGTSSLIDLKEFEVDGLKIDKAFVQHLPHRRKDSAITAAIISLAHNLGIGVTAGGVETAEQLAYLKARDCTSAQGFIFSPPVTAEKFEELMLSGNWSRINRLRPLSDGVVFEDLH